MNAPDRRHIHAQRPAVRCLVAAEGDQVVGQLLFDPVAVEGAVRGVARYRPEFDAVP